MDPTQLNPPKTENLDPTRPNPWVNPTHGQLWSEPACQISRSKIIYFISYCSDAQNRHRTDCARRTIRAIRNQSFIPRENRTQRQKETNERTN